MSLRRLWFGLSGALRLSYILFTLYLYATYDGRKRTRPHCRNSAFRVGFFFSVLAVAIAIASFVYKPAPVSSTKTTYLGDVQCVHQSGIWERMPDAPNDPNEKDGDLTYYYPLGKDALQCNEGGEFIGDFVPADKLYEQSR